MAEIEAPDGAPFRPPVPCEDWRVRLQQQTSRGIVLLHRHRTFPPGVGAMAAVVVALLVFVANPASAQTTLTVFMGSSAHAPRSEEHRSELQSRENLVCRLLLENTTNP